MGDIEVGGLSVWNEKFSGQNIPGSTRVPVREIFDYFKGQTQGLIGLDLGSGQGRSTEILNESLQGSHITALDLSLSGLLLTEAPHKIQARAEKLPFKSESFDFINVCGVMTNLVDKDPQTAQDLRKKTMSALFSAVKPGGCVVISDFGAEHILDDYPVNYDRHALITGEHGTIAVLKTGENFTGKSDQEVAAMKGTEAIERYAHHYTPIELVTLFQNAGFKVSSYTLEVAQTPIGKRPIENIIVTAEKPIIT